LQIIQIFTTSTGNGRSLQCYQISFPFLYLRDASLPSAIQLTDGGVGAGERANVTNRKFA
jgi:hypothetical protein